MASNLETNLISLLNDKETLLEERIEHKQTPASACGCTCDCDPSLAVVGFWGASAAFEAAVKATPYKVQIQINAYKR